MTREGSVWREAGNSPMSTGTGSRIGDSHGWLTHNEASVGGQCGQVLCGRSWEQSTFANWKVIDGGYGPNERQSEGNPLPFEVGWNVSVSIFQGGLGRKTRKRTEG